VTVPKASRRFLVTVCLILGSAGCRSVWDRLASVTIDPHTQAPQFASDVSGGGPTVQAAYSEASEEGLLPADRVQSAAIILPEPIEAEAPLGEVLRQPESYFVETALAGHPRVLAARARVAAATNRPLQASSLADPTITNTFFPISDQALQTAGGRVGNGLMVSQMYPWPEKRWTKEAIACREVQIAAAKLAQVELEIEELAKLAYYELWFADRSIAITEKNRQIAAELVQLAEARNATGGSQQDVLRAQLQVDGIDDRLVDLRRRRELAEADLAALIQRPSDEGFATTENLVPQDTETALGALVAAAERCNPRLRERQWAVSRDRQKVKLAELQKYPDFTLGAGWQTVTESDAISPVANGHDNVSFMVGLTLPIWRDRIRAGVHEARWEAVASNRDYNDAHDDSLRQIRRAVQTAEAAEEQRRLYAERMLPRAKRQIELSAADYRGGRVDFSEVTDGFTEMFTLELQVVRAEAMLAGSLAQLKRAVGCEVATPILPTDNGS
jgi:cobalt-zinc-cadmium efflux system outer membrane protein